MGNCCGKESSNFSGPGRTLGSAPPTARSDATTLPPARPHNYGATQSKPTTQGPGRTLGTQSAAGANNPRSAAAQAAEVRSSSGEAAAPPSSPESFGPIF
ncbi:hypothetical protein BKA81DRAFT_149632 [Phyllosticta paracitricarpa]